jgi:hypothetical protein
MEQRDGRLLLSGGACSHAGLRWRPQLQRLGSPAVRQCERTIEFENGDYEISDLLQITRFRPATVAKPRACPLCPPSPRRRLLIRGAAPLLLAAAPPLPLRLPFPSDTPRGASFVACCCAHDVLALSHAQAQLELASLRSCAAHSLGHRLRRGRAGARQPALLSTLLRLREAER